jgi:hypothetical protein
MQSRRTSLGLRINCDGCKTVILNYTFTSLTVAVALSDGTLGSDRCFPLCQSHSFVLYVCNNSPHMSSGMSSPFMDVCTGAPWRNRSFAVCCKQPWMLKDTQTTCLQDSVMISRLGMRMKSLRLPFCFQNSWFVCLKVSVFVCVRLVWSTKHLKNFG